jgi:hypothetical protein
MNDADSDSDNWSFHSLELEADEQFDESCPLDCSLDLYNKILALRDQRLTEEKNLTDVKKTLEVSSLHFLVSIKCQE